jgi:hypothetical protein
MTRPNGDVFIGRLLEKSFQFWRHQADISSALNLKESLFRRKKSVKYWRNVLLNHQLQRITAKRHDKTTLMKKILSKMKRIVQRRMLTRTKALNHWHARRKNEVIIQWRVQLTAKREAKKLNEADSYYHNKMRKRVIEALIVSVRMRSELVTEAALTYLSSRRKTWLYRWKKIFCYHQHRLSMVTKESHLKACMVYFSEWKLAHAYQKTLLVIDRGLISKYLSTWRLKTRHWMDEYEKAAQYHSLNLETQCLNDMRAELLFRKRVNGLKRVESILDMIKSRRVLQGNVWQIFISQYGSIWPKEQWLTVSEVIIFYIHCP